MAAVVAVAVLVGQAEAQQSGEHFTTPEFEIFVDTAGVAVAQNQPDTYETWIFAAAHNADYPSSGILVAFDCKNHKVARLAHVKYEWNADSTGVEGPVVDDPGEWVAVSDDRIFSLVCSIGRARSDVRQV